MERKAGNEVLVGAARKKEIYKRRTRRSLPKSILVALAVSQSYADTLRKNLTSVEPQKIGTEI